MRDNTMTLSPTSGVDLRGDYERELEQRIMAHHAEAAAYASEAATARTPGSNRRSSYAAVGTQLHVNWESAFYNNLPLTEGAKS